MKTQLLTSIAVRPQPWQISSNKVEQMPMQGLSGLSKRPSSPRGEPDGDPGCPLDWDGSWLESGGFEGMRLRGGRMGAHYKRLAARPPATCQLPLK